MSHVASSSGIVIRCPWCKAKGKVRRPGPVKCPRCKTAFTVGEEMAQAPPKRAPIPRKRLAPELEEERLDLAPERDLDLAPERDLDLAPAEEESSSAHAVCARHPRAKADEACARCGDFVCRTCRGFAGGEVRCPDCSERAGAGPAAAPEVPFGVGSVLEHTFRAAWRTGWRGLLMAFLPSVAQAVGTAAVVACFLVTQSLGQMIAAGVSVFVVWCWVWARSQAGMFALVRASLGDEPLPSFLDAFEAGSGRALGFIWTQFIAALAIAGIMVLAAVVGAVSGSGNLMLVASIAGGALVATRLVRWSVLGPVVFEEKVSGSTALNRSSERVAGRSLQVFAILVIGLVVLLVIPVLVHSLPFALGLIAQVVLGTVSVLLTASCLATIYFALRTGVRV